MTLLVGVWAAYDFGVALLRFSVIIIGLGLMFAIAWMGRHHPKTLLSWAGTGCALWAAGIAIAYILRLNQNSGAVASGLMVLIPLAISGVWWHSVCRNWIVVWIAGGAVALASVVFIVSFERSAWAGLSAGFTCAAIVYWRFGALSATWSMFRRASALMIGVGILVAFSAYGALLFTPLFDGFLGRTGIGASIVQRTALWRDSLALIQDYYFTGSGLGMSAMVYSTYVVLLHVPYWYHAHNLFLQISLEQGVPGLIAFLGMAISLLVSLVKTYHNSGPYSRWFYLATIAALIALLTYGLLDSELYATHMVTTLFLPLGFALALHWAQNGKQRKWQQGPASLPGQIWALVGIGSLPIVVIIAFCLMPGSLVKLYANLGAIAQTKAELRLYQWPLWPIQDELRRRGMVDLSAATAHYEAALALNPQNVTAHQRLGQIALSQGNYPTALEHLNLAYSIAPERSPVRLLLGEVYAVMGHAEQAAALWQTVDLHEDYFEERVWWYSDIGALPQMDWIKQAIVKMK